MTNTSDLARELGAIRRLVAARRKMADDPTTGVSGIDECIAQMARLAGIEVAT